MKRVIGWMLAVLVPAVIIAGDVSEQPITVFWKAVGNTQQVITNKSVRGTIEEIRMDVSGSVSTCNVTVALQPGAPSTLAAINLATNQITGDKIFRPREDNTDVAGTALASDPPGKFYVAGSDSILVTATNLAQFTNTTLTVTIIYSKE